jgi:hypothetical protein
VSSVHCGLTAAWRSEFRPRNEHPRPRTSRRVREAGQALGAFRKSLIAGFTPCQFHDRRARETHHPA